MEKERWILKRRDFIRAGILGSIAFSLGAGRLFSPTDRGSNSDDGNRSKIMGEAQSRAYDLINKYGAEFGAIKPAIRRQ